MKYIFRDTVSVVEERFASHFVKGHGDQALFHKDSIGWYVTLADSHLSIHVGNEQPKFVVGDEIRLTMEKM